MAKCGMSYQRIRKYAYSSVPNFILLGQQQQHDSPYYKWSEKQHYTWIIFLKAEYVFFHKNVYTYTLVSIYNIYNI